MKNNSGTTQQETTSQVTEFDIFPEIDIIDNVYGKWKKMEIICRTSRPAEELFGIGGFYRSGVRK